VYRIPPGLLATWILRQELKVVYIGSTAGANGDEASIVIGENYNFTCDFNGSYESETTPQTSKRNNP
jgi:hypothetical protein